VSDPAWVPRVPVTTLPLAGQRSWSSWQFAPFVVRVLGLAGFILVTGRLGGSGDGTL